MRNYTFDVDVVVLYRERGSQTWHVDEDWDKETPAHEYIMAQMSTGMHYKIEAHYHSREMRSAEEIIQELKRWYRVVDEDRYDLPQDQGRFDAILKGRF